MEVVARAGPMLFILLIRKGVTLDSSWFAVAYVYYNQNRAVTHLVMGS